MLEGGIQAFGCIPAQASTNESPEQIPINQSECVIALFVTRTKGTHAIMYFIFPFCTKENVKSFIKQEK